MQAAITAVIIKSTLEAAFPFVQRLEAVVLLITPAI
jgi:hypothetical protein